MRKITAGRVLSCLVGIVIVFALWGFVFVPGGLSSNILLGILIAGAVIYYTTVGLGPKLDEKLFDKGDLDKIKLINRAEVFLHSQKKIINENKKLLRKTPQDKKKLKKRLAVLDGAIDDLANSDQANRDKNFNNLEILINKVENDVSSVLGEPKRESFFSSIRSLGSALLVALAIRAFLIEPFLEKNCSLIKYNGMTNYPADVKTAKRRDTIPPARPPLIKFGTLSFLTVD